MDAMHKANAKDWSYGACYPCGDGWNAGGYGHTKRQHEGRKKLTRKARRKVKTSIRNWEAAY